MEDIDIPREVDKDTADGALALVQYSRAQKQVFQKFIKSSRQKLAGSSPLDSTKAMHSLGEVAEKLVEKCRDLSEEMIKNFMRPMITDGRQTVLIGKEHFPLDSTDRDILHAVLKQCPDLGKTSQKRRIAGTMESCLCIFLSSFPSEVKKKLEEVLQINEATSTSESQLPSENPATPTQLGSHLLIPEDTENSIDDETLLAAECASKKHKGMEEKSSGRRSTRRRVKKNS